MLAVVSLLGAHIAQWDAVRVDAVTLILLGILCLIPFADFIRKIKLGEFEAEIGRDEVARTQAKVAVELPPLAEADGSVSEERIRKLLREDPRLALAKVRIELEEALRRLYAAAGGSAPDSRRTSLSRMVESLARQEVLSESIAAAVREVVALANRAVHGERVEFGAAEELALLGIQLVREIQHVILERTLDPIQSSVITPEEVNLYEAARYRVTTIVPLVDGPKRNTYIFDQSALDDFLGGYEEYAEFIVAIEKV